MDVLITGGAGFIGSHLVDALVARGDRCTVLDDLSRGAASNLAHHGEAVRLVEGSVTDRDLVADVAREAEAVYHMASVVGVRSTMGDPTRVIQVSVVGTTNVLDGTPPEAAVLVASSSEIYGRSSSVPFDEEAPGLLGPPQVARWSYAHAKACSEHLALAAGQRRRPPTVARYFNVYGPRMARAVDPSVVARFLDAAAGDEALRVQGSGRQTRNFVYVDDAVTATVAALERAPGAVVNLGSPEETTVSRLAGLVIDVTGTAAGWESAPFDPMVDDPPRRSASGRRAADLLGWQPATDLADGLRRTWHGWPGRTTSEAEAEPTTPEPRSARQRMPPVSHAPR